MDSQAMENTTQPPEASEIGEGSEGMVPAPLPIEEAVAKLTSSSQRVRLDLLKRLSESGMK